MTIRKSRWPVVLEGIIANLVLGALFTWSVYRSPLLELFPTWNEGMLSAVFGIHNVFTFTGILVGGRLAQRYSKRKLFFAFACMALVGLGGFSLLPAAMPGLSFALVVLFFAVIASFGIGMGVNIVQAATLPWFPENAGLISGALFMALGLSSFLLAALSRTTLPLLGVRFSIGLIGLLVFVVAMLILADKKALLTPESTGGTAHVGEGGVTTGAMVRTLPFWLLLVWNGCMRAAGFILLDHAAGIAVAFAATALIGMLISPANGFGSLSLGALLDRIGLRRNILVICVMLTVAIGLLIWGATSGSTFAIILGLVLGGISYGGSSSVYSAAIKRVFGGKYFSSNYGTANISMALGALISAFSGTVLDAADRNYMSIFIMAALLLVPILACGIALQKVKLDKY